MAQEMRDFWDGQAATFDDEPDHGLRDRVVRAAWSALLLPRLPTPPASVADLGCGTGSLAVLLAGAGYDVHGIDLSEEMVGAARRKADAAGLPVRFEPGDAADPALPPASFDVVLARHVLWAMPDPSVALDRWLRLLRPSGRLILVEGRWSTGGGITGSECRRLVLEHREEAELVQLDDPVLWGRDITDDRYLVVSPR